MNRGNVTEESICVGRGIVFSRVWNLVLEFWSQCIASRPGQHLQVANMKHNYLEKLKMEICQVYFAVYRDVVSVSVCWKFSLKKENKSVDWFTLIAISSF